MGEAPLGSLLDTFFPWMDFLSLPFPICLLLFLFLSVSLGFFLVFCIFVSSCISFPVSPSLPYVPTASPAHLLSPALSPTPAQSPHLSLDPCSSPMLVSLSSVSPILSTALTMIHLKCNLDCVLPGLKPSKAPYSLRINPRLLTETCWALIGSVISVHLARLISLHPLGSTLLCVYV